MLFSQAFCSRSPRASSGAFSRPYPEFLPEDKGRRVIVTVDTVGKGTALCFPLFRPQGDITSRKDEGNGLAPSKCISLRDAYHGYVGGLHPRGLFPLFSPRECGAIQQAILAERGEWASFKVRSHRKWIDADSPTVY